MWLSASLATGVPLADAVEFDHALRLMCPGAPAKQGVNKGFGGKRPQIVRLFPDADEAQRQTKFLRDGETPCRPRAVPSSLLSTRPG